MRTRDLLSAYMVVHSGRTPGCKSSQKLGGREGKVMKTYENQGFGMFLVAKNHQKLVFFGENIWSFLGMALGQLTFSFQFKRLSYWVFSGVR